jgi:acetylornithine deacetylase/succinyl-diaminopimelate desuccinylase-like protein
MCPETATNGSFDSSETIELTRALIAAPSENPPGDERAAAQVVTEALLQRGIKDIETISLHDHRPNLICSLDSGRAGPTLILCGHLDTKPSGGLDRWSHDPFAGVIENGKLYGLGSCDMKAGVAAIVLALGRIHEQGGPRIGSLVGVFVADEEAGGETGARFLAEAGHIQGDAAILTEPAGIHEDWDRLHLGCRGAFLFRLDIQGTGGHSSLEDHVGGTTATLALARLIDRLDAAFRHLDGVAINVGATVEGGVFYGVRAATASFRGDVRLPPGLHADVVAGVLAQTVSSFQDEHPDVSITVTTDELYPPSEALGIPAVSRIASAARQACEQVLGFVPPDAFFPGATDSFFLQGIANIPTLPALGPGRLREAHQPDEYVSLASLEIAPALVAAVAENYLASDK